MYCKYCYYLNVCPYGRRLVYSGEFMNSYGRQQHIPPPTNIPPPSGLFPLDENEVPEEPKKTITTPKGPIATPYGPITLPPGFLEPLNES